MNRGSSELVRSVALDKYVQPALSAGRRLFSIAVKDIMKDLQPIGFPTSNYPQICTSLRKRKFLVDNSLEIEKIEGPPSGSSPTVVIHYRVATPAAPSSSTNSSPAPDSNSDQNPPEDPAARAERLVDGLFGLLREEMAAYGGGEAFLRWVRSEDDPEDEAFRARRIV